MRYKPRVRRKGKRERQLEKHCPQCAHEERPNGRKSSLYCGKCGKPIYRRPIEPTGEGTPPWE